MISRLLIIGILCVVLNFYSTDSYGITSILSKFDAVAKGIENIFGPEQPPVLHEQILNEEFDFIIVGSGSAGAVLANRLSEVPEWKVLLLEAGRPANLLNQVPLLAPIYQLTGFNWNYTMEKQEGICLGMLDEICAWPKGKALGGTTIINYMIYTRGNPEDFEKWSKLVESDDWSWNKVLPYYLKSEDCNLKSNLCTDAKHHRKGGVLSVEHPFKSELTDAFLKSGQEIGSKIVDYNSDDFMGFSRIQSNQKHGRRHSVHEAYLKPIRHRKNLKIVVSAKVLKILIDPLSRKTLGVEFRKRGQVYKVKSKKEVILSSGTFHSPQLLMLSGIGPKNHLDELKIPIIANLPVGQTLYDHLAYVGLAFTINRTVESKAVALDPRTYLDWITKGQGPLTSLAGIEALAYIDTKISEPNRWKYPNVELIFSGAGSLESDFGLVVARELRIKREIYERVFKPIEFTPAWTVLPMLLHPKSKGFLKLKSTNPYDPPLLFGEFYQNTDDLKIMLESIRFVIALSQTPAFQKYGSKLHEIPIPGCEHFTFNSDEYWFCALRSLSVTLHHQVGTCRMGSNQDPESVVDTRLRVHGVRNLRVVDASVMPVTISAHSSAPTIMIGEKAADFIKQDWGLL